MKPERVRATCDHCGSRVSIKAHRMVIDWFISAFVCRHADCAPVKP